MDEIMFEGSAKLEKSDFMEAEGLVAAGTATGTLMRILNVLMAGSIIVGIIILFSMPHIAGERAKTVLSLVLLNAVLLFALKFLSGMNGRMRASAPINKDRTMHITLYADRLLYTDGYVRLTALYTDAVKVLRGKNGFVLTFDGADYIIIPVRCFGWDNFKKAESFIREKLKKQSGGNA